MRHCEMNDELWQNDFKSNDRLAAEHIAHCDICRADVVVYLRLRRLMSTLQIVAAPAGILAKFNELKQLTANLSMDCAQVGSKLSTWYVGDLDIIESFLLEDHLLLCPACRKKVATLDAVGSLLHRLKNITPPVTIHADMLAMAATVGDALTCGAVLPLLSLWSDGILTRIESFLIEEHLLSCSHCREQAEKACAVTGLMRNLPVLTVPTEMREYVDILAATIGNRMLTCDTALPMIELYRDGMLNSQDSFLLEDHLLWCEPCANVLKKSAIVSSLLADMAQLDPPAAIAVRMRLTRLPIWTKKFAARIASIAAVAAIALTISMFSQQTPDNKIAQAPIPVPVINNNPVNTVAPPQTIQPTAVIHPTINLKQNQIIASIHPEQNKTPINNNFHGVIKASNTLMASLRTEHNISSAASTSMPILRNLQGLPVRQQLEDQKDRAISADYMVNELVASANVKLAPGQSVRPVSSLVASDRITTISDDMTAIAREDELAAAEDLNAAPDSFMIAMVDTSATTR